MDKELGTRIYVLFIAMLVIAVASGCAHLEEPAMDAAPAPATIIEEIPDSALPSNGLAEALAESTLNLLGSFFHHTAAQVERHEPRMRPVVVARAPVVQPAPPTRAHKPRQQTASRPERLAQVKHKPSVNKSSASKSSKKRK